MQLRFKLKYLPRRNQKYGNRTRHIYVVMQIVTSRFFLALRSETRNPDPTNHIPSSPVFQWRERKRRERGSHNWSKLDAIRADRNGAGCSILTNLGKKPVRTRSKLAKNWQLGSILFFFPTLASFTAVMKPSSINRQGGRERERERYEGVDLSPAGGGGNLW